MLSRRLLALGTGSRREIVMLVALGLAITASYVGQGLLIAATLTIVLDGRGIELIVAPVIGVIVLQAVRSVLFVVREERAMIASGQIKERLRDLLYVRLLELGPGYTGRERTGEITTIFVDGVEALERYFGVLVPQLVVSLIGAAVIVTIIVVIDPVVGLAVLACSILVPLAPSISRVLLRSVGNEWWSLYSRIYAENLDAIQGMPTLKAFDAAERRGRRLHDDAERFSRASVRLTLMSVMYSGVVGLGESAGTALAVGIGALRFADGALALPGLMAILLLARECFRPLHDLQTAYHQAYAATITSDAILRLLETTPDVPVEVGGGDGPIGSIGPRPEVVLDDVSFRYRPDASDALRGLSLTVASGETVAIVGPSGAGKSTVVALLLRFFDPQQGGVLVGGHDLRDLAPETVRAGIALVAQDTYLFHGTVRDNLLIARPAATDAELIDVLTTAEALAFVRALPSGLDTMIGERGVKLSGGERQRIAIARALLKDAPLLILDEATSSIDGSNESAIQRALDRLTAGRTTIVIAHRLSTVRGADRIVVLERGRLVEEGGHDVLLDQAGRYARLVAAQEAAP